MGHFHLAVSGNAVNEGRTRSSTPKPPGGSGDVAIEPPRQVAIVRALPNPLPLGLGHRWRRRGSIRNYSEVRCVSIPVTRNIR
jgi:hypothetical protein